MIKVGISGAETAAAGELIRVLIHHPEVEILTLLAPRHKGKSASSLHYGLLGEEPLTFTDTLDAEKLDFLFMTDKSVNPAKLPASLKWIDMSGRSLGELPSDTVYGLSEAFRKPLVRGALHAVLPNPISSVSLIMLNPLAVHLLLSGEIKVKVWLPAGQQGADTMRQLRDAESEISEMLPEIQKSFDSAVRVRLEGSSSSFRGMKISIPLNLDMTPKDVTTLFEGIYDDHNFTFLTSGELDMREVGGTNKCVGRITRLAEGGVLLEAMADPYMRGGAGEAVHVMNLLCGLHEKTGLALKSV